MMTFVADAPVSDTRQLQVNSMKASAVNQS